MENFLVKFIAVRMLIKFLLVVTFGYMMYKFSNAYVPTSVGKNFKDVSNTCIESMQLSCHT
jgi:hypothetical protein